MREAGVKAFATSAVVVFFTCILAGCSNTPPNAITTLRSAQLADGIAPLHTVTLPHELSYSSQQAYRSVEYRFDVIVADPRTGLGVFVTVSNAPIAAVVNGAPAFQNGDNRSSPIGYSSWRASPSFQVAPSLLVAGTNSLVLRVYERPPSSAVLGPVLVGRPDAVERWALRQGVLHHGLPVLIGAALIGIGLISLALWRGRQDNELFLLLACGTLLWGTQAVLQQLPTPALPDPHNRVLMIALYIWFPMLLAVFFMRFSYRASRLFECAAAAFAALAAPALYLGAVTDHFSLASIVLRAGTLVAISIALVAVIRYALHERDGKSMLLLAAGTLCVAFALRDYAVSLGDSSGRPLWLTSYSGIALIAVAGWILVDRYHRAYAVFEANNALLESRVEAARGELAQRLEQVQAAREQAEQANMAKSRFFAAASHDLRQPLHALGLFAETLHGHALPRDARAIVARIGESIGALEALFHELLDLSRLDAGAIEVNERNIALQDVFDRLSLAFHADAVARDLRLRFVPTPHAVRTDPVLLERVLSNLVSNALRYTRQGGVVVGARRRDNEIWLDVVDSGIGIPVEKQQQVFDEFFQIGNPGRDRRHGLGLGLAIVRRLATLMGHRLTMTSAAGRGTRFRLALPQVDTADPPAPAECDPGTEVFAGRRVLLVDDDPDIRLATVKLLAQWGLAVTACNGGAEVEAALNIGLALDVALVDLRLDATDDGIDVIECLRHRVDSTLPALLLSGDTGAAELARVRDSGLMLLTKPVPPARLKSVLHAFLSARAIAKPTALERSA